MVDSCYCRQKPTQQGKAIILQFKNEKEYKASGQKVKRTKSHRMLRLLTTGPEADLPQLPF